MSTRSLTHVIDTRAVKAVICAIPNHWVVRELTERDYGINLMVEIFERAGQDARGLETFETADGLFHIQIKGNSTPIKVTKKGYVSQFLTKAFLKYVESFSVPSFLFCVDLSKDHVKIYTLPLQRYIRNKLDNSDPQWREKTDYDTLTVRIPERRVLNKETLAKIEEISLWPKYLEQLVEFREILSDIDRQLSGISSGHLSAGATELNYVRVRLYRMRRLRVLLAGNQHKVDISAIDAARDYIDDLTIESDIKMAASKLPHKEDFEALRDTLDGIIEVQDFLDDLDDNPIEIV